LENKDTNDLGQELMSAADLQLFLSENAESFQQGGIPAALEALFRRKHISKAALAKKSGMSEVYLHQVFAGRRNPSRSRLLSLCLGLSASLEETQEFLKRCRLAQLYPRDRRDAIIIYGLLHGLSAPEVNDSLFSADEETLF
jgi:transcriptional regulator with XRE-family HTH domain